MKLIAEMCQNHNGDFETLEKMVAAASNAGATHCKLQGLYSIELTNREIFNRIELSAENQVDFRPFANELDRLSSLDLTEQQEMRFRDICRANNVIPMITVFTHAGARRARSLGYTSIKIASYDCASYPLIEYVCEFASEIVISTGATTEGEILTAIRILEESNVQIENQWFLHCVSEYPTLFPRLNLGRIQSLKNLHPNIGFSDHFKVPENLDVDRQVPAKIANCLGADLVEQHFTILGPLDSKDGPISVTQRQIRELIHFSELDSELKSKWLKDNIHLYASALGSGEIEPSVQEWKNRKYYRGRVASWKDGKQIYSWHKWED